MSERSDPLAPPDRPERQWLWDADAGGYWFLGQFITREELQWLLTTIPVAVPARAHHQQDEETKDELARSGTPEIRDPQPAAVTDAGHQDDCVGTELYPAVSPLGRALRRISKGSRLSSLDAPILDDAADALDSGQAVWFALKDVLASAMPNPTEHPAMFKAWERAHAVIKKASGR